MTLVVGLNRAACICRRPIFLPTNGAIQPGFSLVVRNRTLSSISLIVMRIKWTTLPIMSAGYLAVSWAVPGASRLWGLTAWTFHSYSVQYGTPERG